MSMENVYRYIKAAVGSGAAVHRPNDSVNPERARDYRGSAESQRNLSRGLAGMIRQETLPRAK